MKKLPLLLLPCLLLFSGCSTTSPSTGGSVTSQADVSYLKPLATTLGYGILKLSTSPQDKIDKANLMWTAYHAVYSITPAMLTTVEALERYLIQFLPTKSHWQVAAHELASWIIDNGFNSISAIADGIAVAAASVVPAST